MQRTRIKICGITRPTDAEVAVAAGVDALGLVFYPPSSRAVSLEVAEQLSGMCPAMVSVVALFVDPDPGFVDEVAKTVKPQILQYHGRESRATCERAGLPYMKALRVGDGSDIEQLAAQYPSASALLLDTFVEGVAGGTGRRFDWNMIPETLSRPWLLAGGLSAENVSSAVLATRPFGVDVSGGVESAPGTKDAQKIMDFVRSARAADDALMSLLDTE